LPFRSSRSASAYRKVWTERGSPQLWHSQDFAHALASELSEEFEVELAMRYGQPSIDLGLERLRNKGASSLTVFPLYPMNAASSTSSALARVYGLLGQQWEVPAVKVVTPFFDHPGFLNAFAQTTRQSIAAARSDHVLFSFHGLPERQIKKSDFGGGHCLATPSCCERLGPKNHGCYRAQAFFIARAIAQRVGLGEQDYGVAFQSRLGRTPWIRPFTDEVLPRLAKEGKRRVVVVCPSFVADCLETLEEIALRAKESFLAAGGEELLLAPSLNARPEWVAAAAELVRAAG
jgi:ferrochelatase